MCCLRFVEVEKIWEQEELVVEVEVWEKEAFDFSLPNLLEEFELFRQFLVQFLEKKQEVEILEMEEVSGRKMIVVVVVVLASTFLVFHRLNQNQP